MINYINNWIIKEASKIDYIVKDEAPQNETELFNCGQLIIWSGESKNTVFQDETVNFAFRAIHDAYHIKTRIDFSPKSEVYLGRLQASQIENDLISKLFHIEISMQAEYYLNNGCFINDQNEFTLNQLRGLK